MLTDDVNEFSFVYFFRVYIMVLVMAELKKIGSRYVPSINFLGHHVNNDLSEQKS